MVKLADIAIGVVVSVFVLIGRFLYHTFTVAESLALSLAVEMERALTDTFIDLAEVWRVMLEEEQKENNNDERNETGTGP